ncbi:hypothetical protein CJP46_29140 [Paenibacillus sp. XY044]|nr:hypothetical protein CJP46_29140 [Paenibacillus sp. XY044]
MHNRENDNIRINDLFIYRGIISFSSITRLLYRHKQVFIHNLEMIEVGWSYSMFMQTFGIKSEAQILNWVLKFKLSISSGRWTRTLIRLSIKKAPFIHGVQIVDIRGKLSWSPL